MQINLFQYDVSLNNMMFHFIQLTHVCEQIMVIKLKKIILKNNSLMNNFNLLIFKKDAIFHIALIKFLNDYLSFVRVKEV